MIIGEQRLVVVTPPSAEPVTLAEAKSHVVASDDFDDDLIESAIVSAREWTENYLKQSLVTQTLRLVLDRFPSFQGIPLPRPPIQSIGSIAYLDEEGVNRTLDPGKYKLLKHDNPPLAAPAFNETWPSTRRTYEAVTVEYVAGYGAVGAVPKVVKQAMLLMIGQLYLQREEVAPNHLQEAPMTAKNLLSPFRQVTV